MTISSQTFDIEESISRINKILESDNAVIRPSGDYDIRTLGIHQAVVCKSACLSITLHINKFDIDQNDNLYKQYKCLLSEFGAVVSECNGALEYCVLNKNVFCTVIQVDNNETLDKVIDVAAKTCSLSFIMNKRFAAINLNPVMIGLGISFNNVKFTREAFDSNLDEELLWYGDAVDESIKYSQRARTGMLGNSLIITKSVYDRLSEPYRNFFTYDNMIDGFTSSLINKGLEAWEKENLK